MKTYSDHIARISVALADPTRREIMEHVIYADSPLSVREVADYFGLHANAARMHLDKLVKGGLLRVVRRRGEHGGRPANLYDASGEDWDLNLPPRWYKLLAEVMARAVSERKGDLSGRLGYEAYEIGREEAMASSSPLAHLHRGAGLGSVAEAWREEIMRRGHKATVRPLEDGRFEASFSNCPFGDFSHRYPEMVCEIHRCLEEGFLSLAGAFRLESAGKRCVFFLEPPL
ncbi:MAG: helix-turn-helix domain-containing protein [Actinomycetota bacterium]|nr:helix-turn-helix domain-containing protein [Actinomycetota bacterium]MDD5667636.1 helix-turn-helix domain-containing protein [Actinomycetota bacterium]